MSVAVALTIVAGAALAAGVLQALSARLLRRQSGLDALTERINRELPQLQCGECGYPGCRPYAAAVAREEVGIELCPPGGRDTVGRLAVLLNIDAPPLASPPPPLVAVIREADCVGCALCLPVCPTDAIVGAPRFAHAVRTDDCVGCGLCLPPCPADCIELVPAASL